MTAVCTTADAQKKKAKSTKSRTTKTKPVKYNTTDPVGITNTDPAASSSTANAQLPGADTTQSDMPIDTITPIDGYMKNASFNKAKAFGYPPIDNSNVKFFKRVWRDVDTKDKRNYIFDTPGATLADMVLEGIKTGRLTAYEAAMTNSDNTFAKRLTVSQAMSKLQDSAMVDQFDKDGNKIGSKMVLNDFNPEKITKFRIKEDVYFDKKRSIVVTRIIGIAPLMSLQAAGQNIGEAPAFWLYFPQCRNFFATKDVSDPDRNLYDTSMDDIFIQRKYASTIIRASGANGNTTAATSTLAQTATGGVAPSAEDAAKEKAESAKLVEAKIQNYKDNLWQYKMQTKAEKEKAKKDKPAKEKAPKPSKADKAKA